MLTAEACNTGPEPSIRYDNPALRRDRLAWVKQNYVRDDTLTAANAKLVSAQNGIALAHIWGGGEVASADGMRFVVTDPHRACRSQSKVLRPAQRRDLVQLALRSVHRTQRDPDPRALSRDSLVLLAVVPPTANRIEANAVITKDAVAYSDVVFGLFHLLGLPLAATSKQTSEEHASGAIDPNADYGKLNAISRRRLRLQRISRIGTTCAAPPAHSSWAGPQLRIMHTLRSQNPTQLTQAITEFGRMSDKTVHTLNMINNENKHRSTLTQLNRGEGRHSSGSPLFHGKRGELRQRYRQQQRSARCTGTHINVNRPVEHNLPWRLCPQPVAFRGRGWEADVAGLFLRLIHGPHQHARQVFIRDAGKGSAGRTPAIPQSGC